ncbi:MAG: hypothetical protein KY446_12170 [Proteobacteria bacterium]|nr:hypothetical protein [Pseudomonadota bacterium]
MIAGAILLAFSGAAHAQCKLDVVAELPIVMDGNRPLIEDEIKGRRMPRAGSGEAELLLGADFFQAHRVLVSYPAEEGVFHLQRRAGVPGRGTAAG